ncbi:hypothetical protein ACFL2J_07185 [Candidatus Omnitrophota bacterium]
MFKKLSTTLFAVILMLSVFIIPIFTQSTESAVVADSVKDIQENKLEESIIESIMRKKPALSFSFSYYEDSDSVELAYYQQGADFNIKDIIYSISYGRGYFREPVFDSIYEDRYSIGTKFDKKDFSIKSFYILREFSNGVDSHNYKIEYKGQIFLLKDIKLKHSYENVGTRKAIHSKIKYHSYFFQTEQKLPLNFYINPKYEFKDYNDNNNLHAGVLGIFYGLLEEHPIKAGYELHFKDAKNNATEYYTPQEVVIHMAKVKFSGNLFNSEFHYTSSFGIGHASEKDAADKNVNSADFYIEYSPNDCWDIYLYYDFFKDPTYDGQTIEGVVRFKF